MRNKCKDINEARHYAEKLLERIEEFENGDGKLFMISGGEGHWPWPSKEWAAVKRTSMDLTRALAQLRKSIRS